jgi:hypothetical protein
MKPAPPVTNNIKRLSDRGPGPPRPAVLLCLTGPGGAMAAPFPMPQTVKA